MGDPAAVPAGLKMDDDSFVMRSILNDQDYIRVYRFARLNLGHRFDDVWSRSDRGVGVPEPLILDLVTRVDYGVM